MKKLISSLLVVTLLTPTVSWAQDKTAPVPSASASASSSPAPPSPSASTSPPAAPAAVSVKPSSVDVGAIVTPIRVGQVAPYTGVLFSPTASATVISEISSFNEKLRIEVAAAVGKAEAKKDFKYNELDAQCKTDITTRDAAIREQSERIIKLNKDLADAQAAAPSRTLWAGLGFAGGIVVTVATVFAISQATK